jgi:hypothetical protein
MHSVGFVDQGYFDNRESRSLPDDGHPWQLLVRIKLDLDLAEPPPPCLRHIDCLQHEGSLTESEITALEANNGHGFVYRTIEAHDPTSFDLEDAVGDLFEEYRSDAFVAYLLTKERGCSPAITTFDELARLNLSS